MVLLGAVLGGDRSSVVRHRAAAAAWTVLGGEDAIVIKLVDFCVAPAREAYDFVGDGERYGQAWVDVNTATATSVLAYKASVQFLPCAAEEADGEYEGADEPYRNKPRILSVCVCA